MKTEQQYFEEAITMQQYMENMTKLKEQSEAIYEGFTVQKGDAFIEQLKQANVHILAITEDWCGDAMLNNPIIRKVAEAANVAVHTAMRDADTDLIDRYLTNGGRAIPIYLVLNAAGEVIAKWGPRAPELQAYVMEGRASLPDKEKNEAVFEEAQKKFYADLMSEYTQNKQFWQNVYDSFKQAVAPVL